MHAAIKPRQHRELELWRAELSADYQYDHLELWTGNELKSKINTDRYLAGLYDSNSGHLHPLNYTLGLADAAETVSYTHLRAHETPEHRGWAVVV